MAGFWHFIYAEDAERMGLDFGTGRGIVTKLLPDGRRLAVSLMEGRRYRLAAYLDRNLYVGDREGIAREQLESRGVPGKLLDRLDPIVPCKVAEWKVPQVHLNFLEDRYRLEKAVQARFEDATLREWAEHAWDVLCRTPVEVDEDGREVLAEQVLCYCEGRELSEAYADFDDLYAEWGGLAALMSRQVAEAA